MSGNTISVISAGMLATASNGHLIRSPYLVAAPSRIPPMSRNVQLQCYRRSVRALNGTLGMRPGGSTRAFWDTRGSDLRRPLSPVRGASLASSSTVVDGAVLSDGR